LREYYGCSEGQPFAITAVSIDHEIHRVTLLEEAVENEDIKAAQDIISTIDIADKEYKDFVITD